VTVKSALLCHPAGGWETISPADGVLIAVLLAERRNMCPEPPSACIAQRAGAEVINVVPPAHVWENSSAIEMLDAILDEIAKRNLKLVFTRIDASYPPDAQGTRYNYLYGRVLTESGKLPNGAATTSYFRTTAGLNGYVEWMEEETRYYAARFGGLPYLLGINLGPFSEPFSSERGGFLEYVFESQRYEITQYTPFAEKLWHRWLESRLHSIAAVNREYGTTFSSFEEIPLPRNELDPRYGNAIFAYFDFISALNDWLIDCYERCRRIWHETSSRPDIPFILQFCGGGAEKLYKGSPCLAAFDLAGWVVRADALGLSLYSNSGFPDMGHASIRATVNLLALARDMGKEVFVLEGGCEAPNVVLNAHELQFFGTVARGLSPRTYIYEFLKEKFDEPYKSNPGKLVTARRRIRRPALHALSSLFAGIKTSSPDPETPILYAKINLSSMRGNLQAMAISCVLYDLASTVPIRWIPAGAESILKPGIPILQADGSVTPENAQLTKLLASIPRTNAKEREDWRREVIRVLRGE
jgi:hypothetical protein